MEHIRNFLLLSSMFCLMLFSACATGHLPEFDIYSIFVEGVDGDQFATMQKMGTTHSYPLVLDAERFPIGDTAVSQSGRLMVASYATYEFSHINVPVLVTTKSLLNSDTTVWMFRVQRVNGKPILIQVIPEMGAVYNH